MKKFISMALALVMTLSLCTFVATPSAEASFDDIGELSQYSKQAIDVIQEIQVMDGTSATEFAPEAGLTRQAAAKIICNMILGPTTARALPTNDNPFPDVLAGNQFSGYISYCKQKGIISGYADGTFRPTDRLSGYAYLKILLGALGYSSIEEHFTGSNWKVNVAKIALGIGLNEGIPEREGREEGDELTDQITREEAAIYAFNTLQADMVEYESKNTLEINGVKVTMGGGSATPQTWNTSSTSNDNINSRRSDGNNARPIVQFAELYFDKLRREPNVWDTYTQDDFGRPSIRWFWKGVEIGTYPRDPDVTFVGNVKVNAIYEALRQNTGMSSGDGTASLYINSAQANRGIPTTVGGTTTYANAFSVERANDNDLDKEIAKNGTTGYTTGTDVAGSIAGTNNRYVDRIGNGTLIECFRNDATNHVDVCVISIYGGKVDAVKGATAKKDAYVTIETAEDPLKRPNTIRNSDHMQYETEDFDEEDVVAYTYSDSALAIKDMYRMTSESGVLQSRISEKSMTLGDDVYTYSKEYSFHDIPNGENGLSNKSSYIVYQFSWGPEFGTRRELEGNDEDYALWIEEDEFAVDQYVLIERIQIETVSGNEQTQTASVIGGNDAPGEVATAANSAELQMLYQQTKSPLGNSGWDPKARVRYANGTVRTVTLDDSKNYRTSSGNDLVNSSTATGYAWNNTTKTFTYGGAAYTGALPVIRGYNNLSGYANSTAAGFNKGNWIAYPFTAGHIVRISTTSNGDYKLHSLNETQVLERSGFSIERKGIYSNGAAITYTVTNSNGTTSTRTLNVDSETHFAIDDVDNGNYKTYVGIKNAPDTNAIALRNDGTANPNYRRATAYIYHRDGVAKLIFVTNGRDVTSSSNDIVFIAANSQSNRISSDVDDYYTVSAVEKNEVKTLSIRNGALLTGNGVNFIPGTGLDNAENCVILNNVSYDSNDLITAGTFNSNNGLRTYKAQGIRRVNDEEIRINTNSGNSILRDVAENIRVFFVDGDEIDQIDVDEIVNDTKDMVYYVEDDGEITYLFIVDYDDDANLTPVATTYYADGELQQTGNESYTFHYVSVNDKVTVREALKQALGLPVTATPDKSIEDINNGYVITFGGIDYTVTLAPNGRTPVALTEDATGSGYSNLYHNHRAYHVYQTVGGAYTDANAGFIPGETVTVWATLNAGMNVATFTITVDGTGTDVPFTTSTLTSGARAATFEVPNGNFTVKVVGTAS